MVTCIEYIQQLRRVPADTSTSVNQIGGRETERDVLVRLTLSLKHDPPNSQVVLQCLEGETDAREFPSSWLGTWDFGWSIWTFAGMILGSSQAENEASRLTWLIWCSIWILNLVNNSPRWASAQTDLHTTSSHPASLVCDDQPPVRSPRGMQAISSLRTSSRINGPAAFRVPQTVWRGRGWANNGLHGGKPKTKKLLVVAGDDANNFVLADDCGLRILDYRLWRGDMARG